MIWSGEDLIQPKLSVVRIYGVGFELGAAVGDKALGGAKIGNYFRAKEWTTVVAW